MTKQGGLVEILSFLYNIFVCFSFWWYILFFADILFFQRIYPTALSRLLLDPSFMQYSLYGLLFLLKIITINQFCHLYLYILGKSRLTGLYLQTQYSQHILASKLSFYQTLNTLPVGPRHMTCNSEI